MYRAKKATPNTFLLINLSKRENFATHWPNVYEKYATERKNANPIIIAI